jgi:hypothetical protein
MIATGTEGGTNAAAGADTGFAAVPLAGAGVAVAGADTVVVGVDAAVVGVDAASVHAHPAAPTASTPAIDNVSQIILARLVMRRSIPGPRPRRALE